MDHHCPWINNCIGFQNRKQFLLLIFYVLISCYLIFGGMIVPVYEVILQFWENEQKMNLAENIMVLSAFTVVSGLTGVLTFFFKFHITLLMHNTTTIEEMEKKKNPQALNLFDLGCRNNWDQVFGRNPWLWLFPVYGASGRPLGDGVTWTTRTVPSDVELAHPQR